MIQGLRVDRLSRPVQSPSRLETHEVPSTSTEQHIVGELLVTGGLEGSCQLKPGIRLS